MFKSENNQITIEQMRKLDEEYTLVDIRDEISFEYGHIDGAKNIPLAKIKEDNSLLPKDKLVVLCCKSGQISDELAENLREDGFNAVNLEGGYYSWLRGQFENENYATDVEKSIRKKFSKTIWSRFTAAIIEYKLVEPNDKIAVCISGGKDSMLMAKLFQEFQRHGQFSFELVFLCMDPGYNEANRHIIESNAELLGIPLTFFETTIFDTVYQIKSSPCYLCARMRRGHLYKKAKELGCNKIALGHHYDDVIETAFMGMLYSGQWEAMLPRLRSTNFDGMELIRPLYLIREADIIHWANYNDLHFIQCACRFTEHCASCGGTEKGSKRAEIKELIHELAKKDPVIEYNIFRSVENVNLNTVIGYKQDGVRHNFLDTYDEQK
mgnify:CR=1 FL=1